MALPAYAVTLPFGGLVSLGGSGFGSASSLLGLVVALGLLLRRAGGRTAPVPLSATVPLWLMFLGVVGASVLWSIHPEQTLSGFLTMASLIGLYVLLALSRVDRSALRRVENGLLTGALLVLCYGLYQLVVLGGLPRSGRGTSSERLGNDLLGPNHEAVALLLPLLLALSRAVTRPTLAGRLGYGALSGSFLLGILMTGSRGGVLAAVAAVVVMAFAHRPGGRRLWAYLAAGLVVVAVVLVFHPGGIAQREVAAESSSGRTDIWRVGLAACPEYCLAGSGWGTFADVYNETQASVPQAQVQSATGLEAHDVWLLVAIELGLPGLVLFGLAIVVTVGEALRLPAWCRGPSLAGLVGTLVAAVFLSNLEFKSFWMAPFLLALTRNAVYGAGGFASGDAATVEGAGPAQAGASALPPVGGRS